MSANKYIEAYVGDVKRPDAEEHAHTAMVARGWRVETEDDYASTGAFLQEVKETYKSMKAKMDAILAPMKQAEKQVRELFNPALKSLEAAEAGFKAAMVGYHQEQERLRAEQAREAQRLLDAGRKQEAVAVVREMSLEAPKATGVSGRKVWRARVVDAAAVPREFLAVDESALNAFARSTKGRNQVPGVVFYEEETLSVRTK